MKAISPNKSDRRRSFRLRCYRSAIAAILAGAALATAPQASAETSTVTGFVEAGRAAADAGDTVTADAFFRQAVDDARRSIAPEACLAMSLRALSDHLGRTGRVADASAILEERLALRRVMAGDDPTKIAPDLYDAAGFYIEHSDLPMATKYLEEVLVIDIGVFGEDHPLIADSLLFLAFLYEDAGDTPAAVRSYEGSLEVYERIFPADHADLGRALVRYAQLLDRLGDEKKSAALFARAAATKYQSVTN